MKNKFLKILFDLSVIIIFSPIIIIILLILSLLVYFNIGFPIFFIQKRSGINGIPFNLIKFRTMHINGKSDQERLTSFGSFLRKHSLDELPELINVFKGEMSLVGPRPLFLEYNNLYDDYQRQRLLIKPGITGLAQIYGRNNITWEEKFALDINYVNNSNIFMDIKILLISFFRIISDKNVYDNENKFVDKFKGTKSSKK